MGTERPAQTFYKKCPCPSCQKIIAIRDGLIKYLIPCCVHTDRGSELVRLVPEGEGGRGKGEGGRGKGEGGGGGGGGGGARVETLRVNMLTIEIPFLQIKILELNKLCHTPDFQYLCHFVSAMCAHEYLLSQMTIAH